MKEVTSEAAASAATTRREGMEAGADEGPSCRAGGARARAPVNAARGIIPATMTVASLIDEDLAAFLESGVGVHAASRDAANVPCLVRGIGCRVSDDRRRLTVFLLASQCERVLGDIAANGAIAFVASQPSTHRTVQLKGADARAEPPREGDERLVGRQREAFIRELVSAGYDPGLPTALLGGDWADAVAVSFTPTAVFAQTPGPSAGTLLAGGR